MMVDWPTFFGIVQTIANQRGATQRQHRSLASDAGEIWRDNRETVRSWTEQEARDWASDAIDV